MKLRGMLALLLAGCMLLPMTAFATEVKTEYTSYTVDTPYTYPVLPGSDEWAAFNSLEEKIEVCAVDEALMESMTTPALLETVLTYPLLINIYAFDTIDRGFASVSDYFKGVEILLDREDAAACIQAALEMEAYSENMDDALMRDGFLQALAYYQNPVKNSSRISTPGGSTLEVYYNLTWADHGLTQELGQAYHNSLAETYPNATVVSGINPSYNCHSYAWYSTSTSNNCWINNPTPYLTDGSYTKMSSARVGYKVAWPGNAGYYPSIPAHSAIVYSVSGGTVKYISKWGHSGVFIHSLSDCPYSGSVTYWN